MWPSQRGSPERSQGHRPCWRCRSATLVCRTARDKGPGLPERALSSTLPLGPAPLSSRQRRPGCGCHLSLDSMDNKEHYHKVCQPRQRNLGRNVCAAHSVSLKFLRGPLGPEVSLLSSTSQSPTPETWKSPASSLSLPPHSIYHQFLQTTS